MRAGLNGVVQKYRDHMEANYPKTVFRKQYETMAEELKKQIVNECRKSVAGYALPREIEFRSELPKTLVGKVAFHALEEEENAKVAAAKKAKEESK